VTVRLEDALRQALDELAAEARPARLAEGALRRAQRRRLRRITLTAVAAVVATFGVVLPTVEILRGDAAPAPVTPPPATAPPTVAVTPTPPAVTFAGGAITLPGGWMLGAAPGAEGGFWIWDRTRATYRQVPYQRVYPAPVGPYAVVVDRIDERVGVLHIGTDEVRWLAGRRLWHGPEWSADGTRFLMTDQTAGSNVYVVEARTTSARSLHGVPALGDDLVPAFWMPGDRQVAAYIDGTNWQVRSAATGAPVRVLENLRGVTARTAFSPDGRYAVCGDDDGRTVLRVVATGEVRATLPHGRAYWADAERLLLLDGQGRIVTLVDLDGREVGRYQLPADMDVVEGHNYSLIRM
jgi:predicted transcriptional regulator